MMLMDKEGYHVLSLWMDMGKIHTIYIVQIAAIIILIYSFPFTDKKSINVEFITLTDEDRVLFVNPEDYSRGGGGRDELAAQFVSK